MSLVELFILAVGLSMDACAVSVCKGLSVTKLKLKHALLCGIYFGGFQALMPFFGWLLGSQFSDLIASIDHWIAFVLLGFLGINMIREAFSKEEEECPDASFSAKAMLTMAVATSIDALAVGVTFAFLDVAIIPAITFIGVTTFFFSAIGVKIGNVFGSRFKSKAELFGGLVLVLMGCKILIEHLFFGG